MAAGGRVTVPAAEPAAGKGGRARGDKVCRAPTSVRLETARRFGDGAGAGEALEDPGGATAAGERDALEVSGGASGAERTSAVAELAAAAAVWRRVRLEIRSVRPVVCRETANTSAKAAGGGGSPWPGNKTGAALTKTREVVLGVL